MEKRQSLNETKRRVEVGIEAEVEVEPEVEVEVQSMPTSPTSTGPVCKNQQRQAEFFHKVERQG